LSPLDAQEIDMVRNLILAGIFAVAVPSFALADGDGAVKGAVGGAVAGALVGGPVGAAVGGVAGMAVGGAVTGPAQPVVVGQPCNTRTTTTTDNNTGASATTQATNCPN
jgi:hypothetical protein